MSGQVEGPSAGDVAGLRDGLRGSAVHRLEAAYPGHADPPFLNPEVVWRPDVVVAPAGVRDVIEAVGFARRHGLAMAVRAGGVGWCGAGEGTLLLDLAGLDGVRVDPSRRRVRVEGGALWRDVSAELAAFGLAGAAPQFPRLGVAGHVLGGGHGWLTGLLGWASDTLASVDVVTADGELVHASAEHEPELFWGMRGAGHNFGVVVGLELEVVPLEEVTFGLLWFHPDATADALAAYRDWVVAAPDEVTTIVSAAQPPPGWSGPADLRGRGAVHVLVCHSGSAAQATGDLAALRAHPAVVADDVHRMPWEALATGNDVFPSGVHRRTRMHYLPSMSEDVVDITAARVPELSPSSFMSTHYYGGAVARAGEDDTAMSHRDLPWNYAVTASWGVAEDGRGLRRWQDDYLAEIAVHARDAYYVNYLNDEPEHVPAAYNSRTWERLGLLKARWDPANCFRVNQNVPPAGVDTGARRVDTGEERT